MASAVARRFPVGASTALAGWVGQLVAPRIGGTKQLAINLQRVTGGPGQAEAREGIGFYGRYWSDTLTLPSMPTPVLDRRFSYLNYHHILDVQQQGRTPIMVLPHLGSWEWAAAWLGRVGNQKVTAVVERLEDDDVFAWFEQTRSAYGVHVVPLGSGAMAKLMAAAKDPGQIICLVADRDIAGNGVEVDFFGAPTSLPSGPALLSLRTGNPLLPVAIYDDGRNRRCEVQPPIWPERHGRLSEDLMATTQAVATALEPLIAAAPNQWHVLSPVWPDP